MSDLLPALLKKANLLPEKPGVYIMRDRLGHPIYIGKAKALKKRVATYFQKRSQKLLSPKITTMISLIFDFDTIQVQSEAEALILESKLIKQWKPKYNTVAKDDKRMLLLRLSITDPIPQFYLTRNKIDPKSRYFGPFVDSRSLRNTLKQLQFKFGILLGDTSPTPLPDGSYQLYQDARAEIYPHPHIVSPQEYRQRVDAASIFLEGKNKEWIQDIENQMLKAAQAHDFERAAKLRDLLFSLQKTTLHTKKFLRDINPFHKNPQEALRLLETHLNAPQPIHTIECFDISHVSGTFVVASMVHFKDALPDKNHYRRFHIKSFIGNDDYRAMEEVVLRRYQRLAHENKPLPDLILIDGGQGQVNSALKALLLLNLPSLPLLIGLAKKNETIIFSDGRSPLNLPLNNPALHLLQRIRDEAHRFANTFNASLRSKKLKESILDQFNGIGPVRKQLLLNHFKSIDNLKKASPESIASSIPGFSLKLAQNLLNFLSKTY